MLDSKNKVTPGTCKLDTENQVSFNSKVTLLSNELISRSDIIVVSLVGGQF